MSLDFILIKSDGRPNSLNEIQEDDRFKRAGYVRLAERLFGPLEWTGGSAIAVQCQMSFELTPQDVSLAVSARGPGDTVTFMENVASRALGEGVVTVELAGSGILVPFRD